MSASTTDVVAQRSEPICKHMNEDHAESLKAMAEVHLRLPRAPSKITMLSIDSHGFNIRYQLLQSLWTTPAWKRGRIAFPEPLSSDAAVRPTLVDMAHSAEQKRNKNPKVLWSLPRDSLLILFALIAYAILRSDSLPAYLPNLVRPHFLKLRDQAGGRKALDYVVALLVKVHSFEGAAMFGFALYRGAALREAVLWGLTSFFVGITSWSSFLRLNPLPNVRIA